MDAQRLATSVYRRLRTEGESSPRQAAAIGLGVFIGCQPFYGFHLPLCLVAGRLFGLNRLKLYLAANISNPIVLPFLLFAEVQTGRWLRTGSTYPMSVDAFRVLNAWGFAQDLLLGSLVVGASLAILALAVTWSVVNRIGLPAPVVDLIGQTSDRYIQSGMIAWEFANGKLRRDSVYQQVLAEGLLPPRGLIVDLGCGQGLMLALIATAGRSFRDSCWPPGWAPPPLEAELRGVECRKNVVAIARKALGHDAVVDQADLRSFEIPPCDAVLLFDVLHMMPNEDQDRLLGRIALALRPGGILIVREADASGGWGFTAIRIGNWLKAAMHGHWGRRFWFRSHDEWAGHLERMGFTNVSSPASRGMPFANVLLHARLPDS